VKSPCTADEAKNRSGIGRRCINRNRKQCMFKRETQNLDTSTEIENNVCPKEKQKA